MSVTMNCTECSWHGALIRPGTIAGVAMCPCCEQLIDITHAYNHAPWCTFCGDDVNECECGDETTDHICWIDDDTCGSCGGE